MPTQGIPTTPLPPYGETQTKKEPNFDNFPREETVEDDEGGNCGWLSFNPQFLKPLRTVKIYLLLFCALGFTQGALVNGFVNISITSIEKRYNIQSSESGLILSFYEIASLICILPVTYIGGKVGASKPRWLGWGAIIMGIGAFTFTIPHWISGKYEPLINQFSTVCGGLNSTNVCSLAEIDPDSSIAIAGNYKWVFFLAHFLHGIGASPLFSLGITYLDENLKTEDQPFYTGIFYVFVSFGPAVGFLLGSELLRIFIDYPSPVPSEVTITNFIGAYWIGFIFFGFLSLLVGWLLLAFPARLPGIIFVPAGVGATFIGGAVVKKLKLKCRGMLNYCIILAAMGFSSCFIFLLQCPNTILFGLNRFPEGLFRLDAPQFNFTCNQDCFCSTSLYDPICSSDNVLYFSPCFAGCEAPSESGIYTACKCITATSINYTLNENLTVEGVAKPGKCVNDCNSLNLFLSMLFLLIFVTVMSIMPALSATLRCVEADQRSFGLGLQWLIIRLLGSIPGPLAFGTAIDQSCSVWDSGCSDVSTCLVYDNADLSMNTLLITLIMKSISIFFFTTATLFYRPPLNKEEVKPTEDPNAEVYDNPVIDIDL
ncbi:solute carrier organic anion transporter family member 4A1-like isoform X2 [Artemia franciscana]|uniref:solute carrier organic anion transporter family member 4A1-like isoform X2 n=1 Tax=Artemia franciscana TaxID=6661 RepID=UPI0032DA5927